MEIQKVKISDLPVTEDLNGLKTLGTTAENTSKAAELTFIADAATSANEAATNANQAAENANTSAANADAKAEAAQKAADNATASANQADQAAVNANTATTRATAAAEKAENAADVAIGVVNEAQQATANANQAAQSANEAATNANQAATSANDAATEAHTQAEYAKTQGDYAKAEGDRVLAEKGQPGGLAELDESGRVPSSQLPSYVDDVINVATYSQLPNPGESGKIYITEDTNLTYRWSGTGYAEISPSLALGTTAETAGRGDWTQAAYNHSLIKDGSNPHKTTFASLPDKPTSLPANGGNADTVDNLHASSFAQIKSYNFPSGGINNITDLDFTGNIQAHFPGDEYSCIWQGKDYQGTILQLKLRDYAGKQSMMYRGSLTKIWRTVWDSGNFNPDNKFGLSGIISDLNNAPLNAVFSTNGTPANAPLENAYFQGFTFAMDNNPDFKRQWAFKDKKIWFRNLHAGSWSAWTDVIPLDNYLPLSGNKMITGDFQLKDGVAVRDAAGRSVVGLLDVAGDGVCVAVGNGVKKTRIITPDDTPVYRNDSKGAYRIYDSSNLGNATTSKAGLMSAADKTKLDGLSGGGLNIPASGEVAISGWTYNGKQVYAQRWTGEFTGVTKNLTTIEGLSAILMKGGTLFLYGSQSNSVGLGSSKWNQTTGDITRISDLQYNLSTGSVTVAAWYGGTSSPTTVNWSYEVWAAYTK
ncbi:hypothetical protein [Alistipes indistinctus]|uniref:hypothetical protein n=1 Tax=Alistipes indistinctus TaxID=626932 RepID=UPI002674988E|nr:hypothetical protein [Alistipes indistinctus]